MGNPPLAQLVSMGLAGPGVADIFVDPFLDTFGPVGVLVDVSPYVRGQVGVTKTPVRTDQFRDTAPATFTFTLDNYDGRFTPGNTNSPYAVPVSERMQVCWSVGNQLRAGAVLSIAIAEDNWTAVTITCDDMLGAASRNTIKASVADAITIASSQLLLWRMDDATTATTVAEASGNGALTPTPVGVLAFGQAVVPGLPGTQLLVTS